METDRTAKDAEPVFLVEERDPFNQAGDVLRGGASFWGDGDHLEGILDAERTAPSSLCHRRDDNHCWPLVQEVFSMKWHK